MFNKNRIEALSDGIFAIAMTLLILEIKVPADVPPGHLAEAVAKEAHSWVSFAVAFGIACVFWSFQHALFDVIEKVDNSILAANFVLLCFVSTIPFSTSVWGHYIKEPLGLLIYLSNQVAIAFTLTAALEIARVHGHLRLGPKASLIRFRFYAASIIMLAGAIAVMVLPLNWVWTVPMIGAITGRIIRRKKRHATLKAADHDVDDTSRYPGAHRPT